MVTGTWLSADAVTSLAFVLAGFAIASGDRTEPGRRITYGVLVAATGVGSVIQHGPDPGWADLAHDLPIVALLAYLAVDAAADLTGRRLDARWWTVPTLVLLPVIVVTPLAADAAQAAMAAVAVALALQRARLRPGARSTILVAMSLLAVGAVVGTLSRPGMPLEELAVPVPGHGIWHVLAAAALWWLAAVVGRCDRGDVGADDPGSGGRRSVVHTGSG